MKPFYKTERGPQQRWKRGGNDGCREANRATFSFFAWHCCPCQLLNASVSQVSVQLATVLLLNSGDTLIVDHQNTYLAHTATSPDTQVCRASHAQSTCTASADENCRWVNSTLELQHIKKTIIWFELIQNDKLFSFLNLYVVIF